MPAIDKPPRQLTEAERNDALSKRVTRIEEAIIWLAAGLAFAYFVLLAPHQ